MEEKEVKSEEVKEKVEDTVEVVEKQNEEVIENKEDEKNESEQVEKDDVEMKDDNVQEVVEEETKETNKHREKPERASLKNIRLFVHKPIEAIKNAVKSDHWKSGLVCILLYLVVVGLVSCFQFVQVKLSSYDAAIDYAKERLEQAEEDYKAYATSYYKAQVDVYKENLNTVRRNKWKNFADFDFYADITENVSAVVAASGIRFALLIVVLFVVGKMLNGTCKFSQIVAGIGLAVNVQYISLIILSLLAKIPYLSSLAALTGIVGSLFFLLVYFVFQAAFDFEESKSVIWTFVSMLITVFLTNLILYSDVWTSNTISQFLN